MKLSAFGVSGRVLSLSRRVGFMLNLALLLSAPLCAAPVTFRTAYADACLARTSLCDLGGDLVAVSNGMATLNSSYGSSQVGATLSANARADAGFGVLHTSVSQEFDITGTPTAAYSRAWAEFQDVITVDFAPFTGNQGLLYVDYTLDGTIVNEGVGRTMLGVRVEIGPNREQQWETFYSSSVDGLFHVPQVFHFTYGVPFELFFRLYAISGTFAQNSGIISQTGRGAGTADFFNTLTLSGLQVRDEFGAPVPGATFTSASGTLYTQEGVVPEPSTGLLVALGAVALGIARRRRR